MDASGSVEEADRTAASLPAPAASSRLPADVKRLARLVGEHPWTVTAALSVLVMVVGVRGPDFPAQDFRTWLFRHHGPIIWDDQWFAGHSLPGYSLLFPPLAALLGSWVVGVVSCVGATVFGTGIVRQGQRDRHTLALLWFAVAVVANLVVGRFPFALGLLFGLGAVRAVQRGWPVVAAAGALASALASPLAGAFLVLAAIAWSRSLGWGRILPLAGAGAGLAAASIFGERGVFPFPVVTLLAVLAFVGCGLVFVPRTNRVFRLGLVLYGVSTVVLFAVPNPIGGNMSRLGSVLGGPIAALVLLRLGKRRTLALLTGPLLVWQLAPVTAALADSGGDSAGEAYYAGVLGYLQSHADPIGRVEVPMTRGHWETARIAPYVALARGWERQLDTVYNAVLYDPNLTPATYRTWLLSNGVRQVALPDAPLDPSSLSEARVLTAGQPWLRPVWRDKHWRVWEVVGAPPLATGSARLVDLSVASFTLRFSGAGTSTVRLHDTRFWRVVAGAGCLLPSTDGWTHLRAPAAGEVTVAARFALPAIGPPPTVCDRATG